MAHLRRAHEIRPEVIRFGYVYAVAEFDSGQQAASLKTLERMLQRYPANRDILRLLAGYNQQMGRTKSAERYAAELQKLGGSP
jgi:Tfp pilus assembly protein PilF